MNYKLKELKHDGLSFEWEIGVEAKKIVEKLEAELTEKQKTFKMAGYRDGKVPMQMVRKQVGPDILAKIIEIEVDEVLRAILKEKNIKPALQPMVEIKSFDDKSDLVFTAKVEYLPEVPKVDWENIEIETFKVKTTQEDLDRALSEIKDKFKTFKESDKKHTAKKGDAVIIDFHGTVNGKEFDGNKAEGIRLELGSGQFIPGFEEQLIGAKASDALKVRLSFPKNYTNQELAGKPAVFDVKVQQVLVPESVDKIDDEFAGKLGLDSVEKLMQLIEEKITADFNGLARLSMKKKLFDKIDAVYRFDIPTGMIKIDFDTMWNEIRAQKQSNPEIFRGKNEAEMKKEYEEIAKRRVRLGIILAEIARENNIEVGENDLQQAVFSEAMLRPGQEKIVMDFYAKPENLERLKGPILEEKAVDHILNLVKRKETEISSKEFFDKYAEELNAMAQNPMAGNQ
jgi:trigger factor